MYISIDWIKDFTEIPEIDPSELGSKFTMATCEVEEINVKGAFLGNIVIAEIVSIKKHPEADSLNLVTVKISDSDKIEVVCGANNVEVGKKVPYAPLGTTFPNGLTLTPKKIRGVMSEGMLCGETELELGDDDSGLFIQPDDSPVGTSILEYLKIKTDIIFDIDNKSITHRPDLWGHYGMAREFSLVFDSELKNRFNSKWEENLKRNFTDAISPIIPTIQDNTCCLAYHGLSVNNIKVTTSPKWMQQRLTACGIRPINNIVDISNFVMLELGIPLHIFDRAKIKGDKIIVRTASENCKLKTLDDIKRVLISTDTVIADETEALVVAGIMGGASSGVSEDTTNIFIEVANWQDVEVRKTSTRIGLRTDSSQRYEKSLDSELLSRVMLRTLELVLELNPDAKVVGKVESYEKSNAKKEPLVFKVTFSKINKVLGKEIEQSKVISILTKLDFSVKQEDDNLIITVPSFRATKDIDCDYAIIEEIGRIIGYDNITPVAPVKIIVPVELSPAKKLQRKIEDFLTINSSALQVITNPMVGESLLKKSEWETNNNELALVNALSKDHDRMRPSLIPSVLEAAALNCKNFEKYRFFELGRSYLTDAKTFSKEHNQLAIVFYNKQESPFLDLINTIEKLTNFTNIPADINKPNTKFANPLVSFDWKGLHPFETMDIKVMGRNSGVITSLHPIIANKFKIKGYLAIAILDLTTFADRELKNRVAYKPLPKFPSSTFDCTVVTDTKTEVRNIISVFKKKKIAFMDSIKIVDIFTLDSDKKTVTLRATLSDPEKTLAHEFIEDSKNGIVKALGDAGFPLKM